MKAIMMSIKPKWVVKILNGEKTIEIRKRFPKDYVGWVYIYCTKNEEIFKDNDNHYFTRKNRSKCIYKGRLSNGVVVARFWCDKVEEILSKENGNFYTNFLSNRKLLTQSCLAQNELRDYMAGNWKQKFGYYWYGGYAIHIIKLEPFDKPKELKEFSKKEFDSFITGQIEHYKCPLTRAPQSWQFIEV